jgi:GxxExxY protein
MLELDGIGKILVDAAFKVHTALGPGLLESVYHRCFSHELTLRKLKVQNQVDVPIQYAGLCLDSGLRIDLLIEDKIIVEIKAVEKMIPLFESQLLSYLRLPNRRLGYLINFNTKLIKDGIKRMIV